MGIFGWYVSTHPTLSWHTIHLSVVTQMNILIDRNGTPRIAGLGNGYILPHSAGKAESTTAERVSRNCPPESTWPGVSPRITGATHPTKAGDVYAFSVMAFEVRKSSSTRHFPAHLLGAGSDRATAFL